MHFPHYLTAVIFQLTIPNGALILAAKNHLTLSCDHCKIRLAPGIAQAKGKGVPGT
jgi:hypothetical protein